MTFPTGLKKKDLQFYEGFTCQNVCSEMKTHKYLYETIFVSEFLSPGRALQAAQQDVAREVDNGNSGARMLCRKQELFTYSRMVEALRESLNDV